MARIAISYRRADSSAITGRIYDRLVAHFGKDAIFMDVEDIPAGVDFRAHIRTILRDAEVLLVMIGPQWAGSGGGPSRLRERADPVRLELEEAFVRQIKIIPVLIEGAATPASEALPRTLRALPAINAAQVASGRHFSTQMNFLIDGIHQALSASPAAQNRTEPAAPAIPAAAHDQAAPQPEHARSRAVLCDPARAPAPGRPLHDRQLAGSRCALSAHRLLRRPVRVRLRPSASRA